jgi:uncharacterized tellurite resistance protein B-like protein
MPRLLLILMLAYHLAAQGPVSYVNLPGEPLPQAPIRANAEGGNAVFHLGEKSIVLENFKFKKPWLRSWQISFNVRNRTEHQLEDVELHFPFINKAGEVVSDPQSVPTHRIFLLGDSVANTLQVQLTIPSELRPGKGVSADGVTAVLVSLKAKPNRDDFAHFAREKAQKEEQERLAALKVEQEKAQAEAKARQEQEEADRLAAADAQAKREEAKRAAEAARRKQLEAQAKRAATSQGATLPPAAPESAQAPKAPEEDGTAVVGVLVLFGMGAGALAIAFKNSKAGQTRKMATNAVASINWLGQAIAQVKSQALERVQREARNYVVTVRTTRLAAINIDVLRQTAPGVRLQLLKTRGYERLSQLRGVSAQTLMAIKGIGPDSANRIVSAAFALISESDRALIPVPIQGKGDGTEHQLLGAVCLQSKVESLLADPNGLLAVRQTSLRKQAAQVHAATSFWKWLFGMGKGPGFVVAATQAKSMAVQVSDGPGADPVVRNLRTALAESESAMRLGIVWTDIEEAIAASAEAYRAAIASHLNSASQSFAPGAALPSAMVGAPPVQAPVRVISPVPQIEVVSSSHSSAGMKSVTGGYLLNWLPEGREVTVAGYRIPGGMIYLTESTARFSGGGMEASAIDPKLPVQASAADCRVRRTNYWPSYDSIGPDARASYLQWLASGKANPEADIGYVFLYFYGLERRALIDAPRDPVAKAELLAIEAEVLRLLGIYKGNRSFWGYANSLVDYLRACRGEAGAPVPAPNWVLRGLSLGQKITLGKVAEAGEPVPPELALDWFLAEPSGRRRNSLERCPDFFRAAFVAEFSRQFPDGLKLLRNKTMLKVAHRAASGSLSGGVFSVDLPFPDVSVLGSSIQKIQKVGDTVGDVLEPYSRFLGRNPSCERSLDGLLLLPKYLWPESILGPLSRLAQQVADTERPLVMRFVNLQMLLPEGAEYNKTRYGLLCHALDCVGLGIEPDPKFGGAVPNLKDPIALFKLPGEGSALDPSPAFKSAALLVHLASAVVGASGDFGEPEATHLMNHLHHGLTIPEHETQRLLARVELYRKEPPPVTGLKRKVDPLPLDARKAIGDFLVHVVNTNGAVSPGEVRTLERVFKLLGIEAASLYSQLHGATAEPITVRPATDPGPVYRIPPPKVEPALGSAIRLDMAKVAALKEDSAKVAALLGSIFTEAPAAEPSAMPEPEMITWAGKDELALLGLDPDHGGLLRTLLGRPQWTRAELEEMCSDRGLMVDGAIERINEAAFEQYEQPLIEGEDPLDINIDLTLEMTS